MSQVSSVSDTSYAYLATLSRLDTNGDGVLSRGERAADDKPGILKQLGEEDTIQEFAPKLSDGVLAFMMGTRESGSVNFYQQSQQNTSYDVYKSTYGQYDLDTVA
ncbi:MULTISPECIES: hypothetical protein [unclassified Rhizobium]|jgi:hypothetical protein|uniref:hypothetical protein n=1 Tax=unclassified Rhizobium TaxID=2613769 RepID=UPI000271D307|nr:MULTISPECIES: hypothetical protein [unclassified Rhizobium]EJL56925.1 hypothetical protein PMI09_01534 [Rhizobium sp. CF122]MBB3398283.1 hypothetical protein [Rhizobium sp. BK060]MBB4168587.1 hypothetical protein [Rhizobium sp. BK538]TCM73581.1 hypothetical protein EV291_11763 [Rhizobium sp. BK068]